MILVLEPDRSMVGNCVCKLEGCYYTRNYSTENTNDYLRNPGG